MRKRFYTFIKRLGDSLSVTGLSIMFIFAVVFYFANANVKDEIYYLMPYPTLMVIGGIVCEMVRIFMNDRFKYEKSEEL